MRHATAAILFLAMLVTTTALADEAGVWVPLTSDQVAEPGITILESDGDHTVIQYELPGFLSRSLDIDGQEHVVLAIPGHGRLMEGGAPDLPTIRRSIIVPDDGRFAARVLEVSTVTRPSAPLAPSKGHFTRDIDPETVPYVFGQVYEQRTPYPADQVVLHQPYILRDFRGMVVEVNPIRFDPAAGSLEIAERLVVEITRTAPGGANVKVRSRALERVSADFDQLYRRHFLNYEGGRYTPIPEPGRLAIITADAFHSAVEPLQAWKLQMGLPSELHDLSEIGSTAAQVKAWIDARYAEPEGLTYVILVGDVQQVPTLYGTAEGAPSDPCYAKCEGADHYPDLFISRLSAQNLSQVQTQVAKVIGYEMEPDTGAAAAWYAKATGIASAEGSPPDYTRCGWLRDMLLAYTFTEVDEIYDPGASASQVTAALNEGRSLVNYIGHGSGTSWSTTGFNNSNVLALSNVGMLPWIIDVACQNGDFTMSECFAEAWMRAGSATAPTGAVSSYAASTNASWVPPCDMQYHSIELLTTDERNTLGGLLFNGVMYAMDVNPGYEGTKLMEQYNIFGDCSMMVRTDVPEALDMQHLGVLMIGLSTYDVTVTAGGAPVAGALVCGAGDGGLLAHGYTDAAGQVTLDFGEPVSTPGTLSLTATAYNGVPDLDEATIIPPSGPYCVVAGHTIDDDMNGTSWGNGDGLPDAGETIELVVTLHNVGNEMAHSVTATLATGSPYVTVTDGEESFGDIAAGAYGDCLDDFDLELGGDCPDGHLVVCTLTATDGIQVWESTFSMTIGAPVLAAVDLAVDDSGPSGNGDGGADPGETVSVALSVVNIGHAATAELTGTLTSTDPNVTITDGLGECAPIPVGLEGMVTGFEVQVLPSCPSPAMVPLELELTAGDFTASLAYELAVGPWFDDGEADRGWTLGAPGDDATTGQWIRAEPVGTVYNSQQCQTEYDHTTDPGSLCFVTGNGTPGGAAGEADVDNGTTTLLTPVFDMTDAVAATLSYWRWYTNDLGNNPGQDWWDVDATADGQTWVHLEHTMESANAWTEFSWNVGEHVAFTDHFQVRFVADDTSPGSLVEGAVDDLMLDIIRQPSAGAPDGGVNRLRVSAGIVSVSPNPFNPHTAIVFGLGERSPVTLKVYDVGGRLVRTLLRDTVEAGTHTIVFDGRASSGAALASGIYFLRLDTPGLTQVRQLTLVK
ncbi:MAG: C25 family cysteine peptidase [Candidatus Eiseniibacteriota bacterium]|jgi:hypothetical protein